MIRAQWFKVHTVTMLRIISDAQIRNSHTRLLDVLNSTAFTSQLVGFLIAEPALVASLARHRGHNSWIYCDWGQTWLHGLRSCTPQPSTRTNT